VFSRKFNFDIYGSTIRDSVTHNVAFAVLAHTNDTPVLGVELTYRAVSRNAAVFTERCDNLVL
jgi:hypothetical protein